MKVLEALKLSYDKELAVRPVSWAKEEKYVIWYGPFDWMLYSKMDDGSFMRQRIRMDAPHILFSDEEWEIVNI